MQNQFYVLQVNQILVQRSESQIFVKLKIILI